MTAAARPWGRRVGLLAGGGRFPLYFAEAARRQGMEVVCVAVKGHADADLQSTVSRLYWTGLAKIGRMIRCFRREGIDTMVMAGKIHKVALFPWRVFAPAGLANDSLLALASRRDNRTIRSSSVWWGSAKPKGFAWRPR